MSDHPSSRNSLGVAGGRHHAPVREVLDAGNAHPHHLERRTAPSGSGYVDVFDQEHERQVVERGGFEPEVPVEPGGLGSWAWTSTSRKPVSSATSSALSRKCLSSAAARDLTLVVAVDGRTTEKHGGQGVGLVTGCTCGGLSTSHYSRGRGVEGDHPGAVRYNPGPAGTLSLVSRGARRYEPVVERFVAAVESLNIVRRGQKLWPLVWVHSESRTESFASKSTIFALAVAGRSSIA